MFGLGFQEILLIFLILFFLFGAKKLPEIGEGLGKTVKEIRKIRNERRADKEKKKEEAKSDVISDLKKEVEAIPGVKEVKDVKATIDEVKNVAKATKFLR